MSVMVATSSSSTGEQGTQQEYCSSLNDLSLCIHIATASVCPLTLLPVSGPSSCDLCGVNAPSLLWYSTIVIIIIIHVKVTDLGVLCCFALLFL